MDGPVARRNPSRTRENKSEQLQFGFSRLNLVNSIVTIMRLRQAPFVMFLATTMLARGSAVCDEPKLTPAAFAKLYKELTSAKEPWQSIPWQLSLIDARALAAKENKPVYMLCRAGHPLGCV